MKIPFPFHLGQLALQTGDLFIPRIAYARECCGTLAATLSPPPLKQALTDP
jgi:hypothetical protein